MTGPDTEPDVSARIRVVLLVASGLIVASAVPAGVFALGMSMRMFFPPALMVFGGFAALFGLPIFISLRQNGDDSLLSASVTGLGIGAGPVLLFGLLSLVDDGQVPGWTVPAMLSLGALGTFGGATFWLVVVYPRPLSADQPRQAPSWVRTVATSLAATALIGVCYIP